MKTSALTLALAGLLATISANPIENSPAADAVEASSLSACGAAGSCAWQFGGGDLCNDRCKKCSGPSGAYARGACCGTLWQTCCCYYS